jgi:adenylosuccinate synthase
LDDKSIDYVPAASSAFYRIKTIVSYTSAFTEDVSSIKTFKALPKALQQYVKKIEKASGCKIVGLGVGPKRDQFIII